MIGAFWNIRGLNKEGRLQCLADFVKDNSLDFVGVQETKKENFTESFLSYINKDFAWHVLPAKGTAGGILVGLNGRKFEMLACMNGEFCSSVMIKSCYDKFVWRLVVVYGSAYEEGKLEFINELYTLCGNWDGPTVFGGDFNLVSCCKEKNNGRVNVKWVDLFKDWKNKFGLIELKPSNRSYTWTNNQEQPVMAALDKVFCSSNFEQKFSLAYVSTRARGHSDHVPLILNLNCSERKKPSIFRFEKWWFEQPDFKEFVTKVWRTECAYTDPIAVWQFKIRLLRKKVKGWSWNRNADIRKLKQQLLKEFEVLDIKQETGVLNQQERERMENINKDLEALWRIEETKVRQRSRERRIKEGDRNTAYFQAVAKQKHRKREFRG